MRNIRGKLIARSWLNTMPVILEGLLRPCDPAVRVPAAQIAAGWEHFRNRTGPFHYFHTDQPDFCLMVSMIKLPTSYNLIENWITLIGLNLIQALPIFPASERANWWKAGGS
jgi:hypothetical protein